MHFIKQKQQTTTICPQCDNVVRIDAEVCNICGKQLRGSNGKTVPLAPRTPTPAVAAVVPPTQAAATTTAIPALPVAEEEYEDDEEEYEEEEEDDEEEEVASISSVIPSAPSEILRQVQHLQSLTASMERYFPAELPEKPHKLALWRKQLQRAHLCAEILGSRATPTH